VRDLVYQDEMLSLLKLPPQQNRDAVMILHMGGIYGDKVATLDRFRSNYTKLLSPSVKARLVLENDDVGWSVHDLLPICEELNIPLVLDFHHHNIIFDSSTGIREGTQDIMDPKFGLAERIKKTWSRKEITQKMHYSEPRAGAVTSRDRRMHSDRVKTLPPCPPDMDLMIEAKDKEQAVFDLMRTFRLPGFEKINDIVPHERDDQDEPEPTTKQPMGTKPSRKRKKESAGDDEKFDVDDEDNTKGNAQSTAVVPRDEFAMGGSMNRVYWPEGREDWLKPRKRELKRSKKAVMEEAD